MHRAGKLRRTGVRSLLAALPAIAIACASEQAPRAAALNVPPSETPVSVAARAAARAAEVPRPVWAFHAGGSLASSVSVSSDDGVLVATLDGTVHALRSDGSFRWSFSLNGSALGRAVQTPDGDVYAATKSTLWALDRDGGLRWSSRVPGGVTAPPALDARGRLWIMTGGGTLLGYGRHGGVMGFAKVSPAPTLGPVALERGEVAVVSADGTVRVTAPFSAVQRAVTAAPLRDLRASGDALWALGPDALVRLEGTPPAKRWERAGVTHIACTRPSLVVLEAGVARWLSDAGEPAAAVAWSAPAGGPLACLRDGSLLGVSATGELLRVSPSFARKLRLPAGDVLGLEPTAAGLIIAAFRDGRVLGLSPPN
jgi:hypothetical protein